jgi:predicted trehalose synthase
MESQCVPADDATFRTLITLFEIDCALRELRREVERRPAWVDVPIRALLALIARQASSDSSSKLSAV